jgi:ElaB/YqjD/DUF883 family membrane-anchored ribosome-binding protein
MNDVTHHLLVSQRNQLLEIVRDADLFPGDFEWQERDGSWAGWVNNDLPTLIHVPSDFFCAFALAEHGERPVRGVTYHGGRHMLCCSPGADSPRDLFFFIPWADLQIYFRAWLENLKRELVAPDLWATIRNQSALLRFADREEIENSPFSVEERNRIQASLEQIKKEMITTRMLTVDQTKILVERLDYLVDASSRLGRKDWIVTAMGAVIGVVVQAALSSNTTTLLLQAADQALGWLVALTAYLPK